jgi:hypothetical protein
MNRHPRRVASTKARLQEGRQVRLHEAGHAVGRIIVADEFGVPPEEMIESIEIGFQPYLPDNAIAGLEYASQAVTFGGLLSEDLDEIVTPATNGKISKHDIAQC